MTAKGSKDLADGRRLHLLAAISFNRGVILREVYQSMNGEFFASFVRNCFPLCFARVCSNHRRFFLMDNESSLVSKVAKLALQEIDAEVHRIPARSPCVNPVENMFHIIQKMLADEAIRQQIVLECFNDFKNRVLRCFDSLDPELIDHIMPKQINQIIASKGARIKY